MKDDAAYREGYWNAFNRFFGPQNGPVVKAMLLAKFSAGDVGDSELDRVCFGLRQTMGWIAEAIERAALESVPRARREERPAQAAGGKA